MRIDRLKQRREHLKLTQTELAERIGVEKQTVYRYEKGLMDASSIVLEALSRELDVTADWLLGLVDNEHSYLTEAGLDGDEEKLLKAVRDGRLAEAVKLAADLAENNQKPNVSVMKPATNS